MVFSTNSISMYIVYHITQSIEIDLIAASTLETSVGYISSQKKFSCSIKQGLICYKEKVLAHRLLQS